MEKNLTVFERTLHKIHITFAEDASVSNFTWCGAAKSMYGCECFHFDSTIKGNEVIMTTPSLSTGLYKYQIFCKNRDNVEYLVLSGDINVKDKLCDCDQQPAIDSNESTAEVTVSPEVINVTVILPGAEISGNYLAFEFLDSGYYNVTSGRLDTITSLSDSEFLTMLGKNKCLELNCDFPDLTSCDRFFKNQKYVKRITGRFESLTTLSGFLQDSPGLYNGTSPRYDNFLVVECEFPEVTRSGVLSGEINGPAFRSWKSDLPKLVDGTRMFDTARAMEYFDGDLSSLEDGTYMFGGYVVHPGFAHLGPIYAPLNVQSIKNIAQKINNLAEKGKTGPIHIGVDIDYKDDPEVAEGLDAIRAKGWDVTVGYWTNEDKNR